MPAGPDQQECLVAPSAVLGPPPGLSLVPLLPTACQPGGGGLSALPRLDLGVKKYPGLYLQEDAERAPSLPCGRCPLDHPWPMVCLE